MFKAKLIFLIIIILFLFIIILQNLSAVRLNILWWHIEMSLFAIPVIIILSMAAGYIIATINIRRRNKK